MDAQQSSLPGATGRQCNSPIESNEPNPSDSTYSFHETREAFNSRIKPPINPVKHEKVLVLMLYWEKSNIDVQPEVRSLREVFERKYGFQVEEKPIRGNLRCKPSVEVCKAINDLFYFSEHDHTLFIIYYAGHGWINNNRPGEVDEFKIAASSTVKARRNWQYNEVVWHQVEKQLQTHDADILVIFDCCRAGWLRCNKRDGCSFSFEYLAACDSKEEAYGPEYEYSYTKALVCALNELAEIESGFSTGTLQSKVKEHQLLLGASKDEVHPLLFPRDPENHSRAHIWIQRDIRLVTSSAQHNYREDTSDGKGPWQNWYLRLSFNQVQTLEAVKQLGDAFDEMVSTHSHQGLRSVELLESPQDLRRLDNAVYRWTKQIRTRKSETELLRVVNNPALPAGDSTDPDSAVEMAGPPSLQLESLSNTPVADQDPVTTVFDNMTIPFGPAVGDTTTLKRRSDEEHDVPAKRCRTE